VSSLSLVSRYNKKVGKRGNVIIDTLGFFIFMTVFILIVVTGYWILSNFNTEFQAEGYSDNAKNSLQGVTDGYPLWYDYGIGFCFILFTILVIVASYNIDTTPVLFPITMVLLLGVIFAANQFVGAIDDYFADPEIATAVVSFPISEFIVNNMEIILVAEGALIALALYAKRRGE